MVVGVDCCGSMLLHRVQYPLPSVPFDAGGRRDRRSLASRIGDGYIYNYNLLCQRRQAAIVGPFGV